MSNSLELNLNTVSMCPLCASDRGVLLDVGEDRLLPEVNRYLPPGVNRFSDGYVNQRYKCIDCGLIFLSPRPSPESLSLIYSRWYGYAYQRVMSDLSHIEERRKEFERYHLSMLETACPQRGRLLDVGCGSGLFLGLAKKRGWEVSGIELDPSTAAWGKEHEDIADMRCGVLASVLAKDEQFDAITMFDYLEHTDRPGEDLDCLISRLAPGGVLMVRVPNAGGWQSRVMGSRWIAIMPTHLSYFSANVLAGALTFRGLNLEYLSAPNFKTELDIIKQRISWIAKRLRPSSSSSQESGVATFNPDIGGLGSALGRWVASLVIEQVDQVGGWFGAGNNLTAIARKLT